MLFDPGRSPASSPLALASVLGSVDATTSPPACCRVVSRLDCFSGVRLPLTACEVPCVRFQKVVRPASLLAMLASPSFWQHSVLGGWLDLSIQFFRSEPCHVCFMPSSRDFHPQSRQPLLGAPHLNTAPCPEGTNVNSRGRKAHGLGHENRFDPEGVERFLISSPWVQTEFAPTATHIWPLCGLDSGAVFRCARNIKESRKGSGVLYLLPSTNRLQLFPSGVEGRNLCLG
jgi:hypothetical protein